MAFAAALLFFDEKSKSFSAFFIFSFGSLYPITPVELIMGFVMELFICFAYSNISSISSTPSFEVIALAFFELISIKFVLKFLGYFLKCFMGAAAKRLVVKTADISHNESLFIKAKSYPSFLSPAFVALLKNPSTLSIPFFSEMISNI